MKSPKEFDYDLWTTKDSEGKAHYWAKVKETGEIQEVSHEIMKFLRSEEKKLRRELNEMPPSGPILSLDTPHDDEKSSWFEDRNYGVIEMETKIAEEEFRKTLTDEQLNVYMHCIRNGESASEYAKKHHKAQQTVFGIITAIREKAKIFY